MTVDPVDGYTVGEVAELAHVTVRALHHYDDIGLLRPSGRSNVGYRLYSATDLTRLHQIMSYRTLGFGLGEIAEMLVGPDPNVDDHLRQQQRLLRERITRDQALLEAIEKHMETRKMGITLTPEQQFELFGRTDLAEQLAEAEKRYGEFEWWQEQKQRATTRTYEDWLIANAEGARVQDQLVAAFQAGEPADGEIAMALTEEARQQLDRWSFSCDHALHLKFSQMVAPQDRALQDEHLGAGFTQYAQDAVKANAERAAHIQ